MSLITYEGIVEKGQVVLPRNIHLPEKATVYIVVLDKDEKPNLTLADLVARMPPDYQVSEEDFGSPVGQEVW